MTTGTTTAAPAPGSRDLERQSFDERLWSWLLLPLVLFANFLLLPALILGRTRGLRLAEMAPRSFQVTTGNEIMVMAAVSFIVWSIVTVILAPIILICAA
jgi:hypothetical protein